MLTKEQREKLAQHFNRLDQDRKFMADAFKQLRVELRVVQTGRKTMRRDPLPDGLAEETKADKILPLLEKLGECVDQRSRILQPFRHLLHNHPDAAAKAIRQLRKSN
ncbi:MAG: hypothetical protein OEQ18_15215 [Gammaproteobacteria bacterium]|nr:hypothetical protein [Gammaproteobacteria bacterium]